MCSIVTSERLIMAMITARARPTARGRRPSRAILTRSTFNPTPARTTTIKNPAYGVFEIDVRPSQRQKLAASRSTPQSDPQEGSSTRFIGGSEERLHFFNRERNRATARDRWRLDDVRDVACDQFLAQCPSKCSRSRATRDLRTSPIVVDP